MTEEPSPTPPPPPPPPPPPETDLPVAVSRPQRQAGTIPRMVELPISLWSEILSLANEGGIDHRDAILSLLDLGLLAQKEDAHQPRFVAIDDEVWKRIELAKFPRDVTPKEALTYLIDLGLQARAAKELLEPLRLPADDPRRTAVKVKVILQSTRALIAEVYMEQIPAAGDLLAFGPHDNYVVRSRSWVIQQRDVRRAVYLRVDKT